MGPLGHPLQCDFQQGFSERRGIRKGNRQDLFDRLGDNHRPEEVIRLPVFQSSEVKEVLLQLHGEREACRRRLAFLHVILREASSGSGPIFQPVDTRIRRRRIKSGGIKFDSILGIEAPRFFAFYKERNLLPFRE